MVAFGLNALFNRSRLESGEWGPWDSSNARDFIKFTVEQGIAVEAWELGNQQTLVLTLKSDESAHGLVIARSACRWEVTLVLGDRGDELID